MLTVVAEEGQRRDGVSLLDDIVREGARRMTPHIAEDRRARAPWYRTKTQPSHLDMIVKLRRTLIAARFLPASPREPTPQETLAVHLAWAEAAA